MISTQDLVNLFAKKHSTNTTNKTIKKTLKCSLCKCEGHNKRKCNNIFETDNVVSIAAPAPTATTQYITKNKKSTSTNTTTVKMKTIAIQVNPPKEKKLPPEVFQCPICFKNINDKKNMVVTKCGHKFCSKCIFEYLKRNDNGNKCPMCRTTYAPSMETQPKFTERFVNNTMKHHLDEILIDNSNTLISREDIRIRNPNNGRTYNVLTRAPEFSEILSQSPYEVKHANYLKLYDKILHKFMPTNRTTWENHNEFSEVIELLMDTIQDSIMQFSDSLGVTDA